MLLVKQPMNDRHVSIVTMVDALFIMFAGYPDILAAVIVLAQVLLQTKEKRNQISAVAVERDEDQTSTRDVKDIGREKIAKYIFKYSRKLRALGKLQHIQELINLTITPVSIIERMRFASVVDYGNEILALVKKYKLDLADNKVTEEMIAEFETELLKYKDTVSTVDSTHAEGVAHTKSLDEMVEDLMDSIDIMDDIVEGLRDDYPDFCNVYDATRSIYHYGVRHSETEETPAKQPAAVSTTSNETSQPK